ncbi:MAG: Hpt domain-containing protein, partial [Clostridia bacterium]
ALARVWVIAREAFEKESLLEYKTDVHALKSASLSIGAVAISENARLLEHASTKKDITYIKQHTREFLDDLTILLDNIHKALENFAEDYSGSNKEVGNMDFFNESLKKLQDALDGMNIERCEVVLTEIMEFKWDKNEIETIKKIKEFLISYDYDSASEFIVEIIS